MRGARRPSVLVSSMAFMVMGRRYLLHKVSRTLRQVDAQLKGHQYKTLLHKGLVLGVVRARKAKVERANLVVVAAMKERQGRNKDLPLVEAMRIHHGQNHSVGEGVVRILHHVQDT